MGKFSAPIVMLFICSLAEPGFSCPECEQASRSSGPANFLQNAKCKEAISENADRKSINDPAKCTIAPTYRNEPHSVTVGEEQSLADDAKDPQNYKYRGNLFSMKFHRMNCEYGKIMARAKRVQFHFRKDAISAGMSPCNWCLPRYWTSVRGKIIHL